MVLFFLTSQKNAVGPKGQAFEASHEEAQVSSGHPKGWVTVMRTWQSPYEIIGDGCDAGGQRYQTLDRFILREQLTRLRRRARLWTRSRGGRHSHYLRAWCLHAQGYFDGRYRRSTNFFWYEGTSTVDIDRFFFGMNPYRRSISTDFWVKSTFDQISTVFSSR